MKTMQKGVVAMGLLMVLIALVWAPFNAHYKRNKIDLVVDAGYGLAFKPPGSDVCRFVVAQYADARIYEAHAQSCTIRLDGKRQITAVGAVVVATISGVLLMGLFGARRDPDAK